jgi:hypothetical protein
MTCKFLPDTTGLTYFKNTAVGAFYANPVQAALFKDCHLITALSSLAWVNKNFFSNLGEKTAVYHYSFYDLDPDPLKYPEGTKLTASMKVEVYVNSTIFMDTVSKIWCCSSSKAGELWVPMYEKAFAKFCMFKIANKMSFNELLNSAVDPDFSMLPKGSDWGGNPAYVLGCLAGFFIQPLTFLTTDSPFVYGAIKSIDIYEFIKALCNYSTKIGTKTAAGVINGAKVRYPMGAWTYYDKDAAKKATNIDIIYDAPTIVADHCYSVLGVYESDGNRYIILRNPYGSADPALPSLGKGPVIYYDVQNKIENLALEVSPQVTVKTLDLNTANDGIFALDVKVFSQYFKGFGFIPSA